MGSSELGRTLKEKQNLQRRKSESIGPHTEGSRYKKEIILAEGSSYNTRACLNNLDSLALKMREGGKNQVPNARTDFGFWE